MGGVACHRWALFIREGQGERHKLSAGVRCRHELQSQAERGESVLSSLHVQQRFA